MTDPTDEDREYAAYFAPQTVRFSDEDEALYRQFFADETPTATSTKETDR